MLAKWQKGWPLFAGLLAVGGVVAWTIIASLKESGGHIVYALDDAYIHMTIAKNLVASGVWGLVPGKFASASSSPLWTAVLALLYRACGVHQAAPLILNLAGGVVLLCAVFLIALRFRLTSLTTCALIVAVGCLAPISTLVMEGLEHIWQAVFDLTFLASAVTVLVRGKTQGSTGRMLLFAVTPCVALIRFEGVFPIAVIVLLLAVRSRWRDAATVAALGAVPLLAIGLYSVAHGGWWVPNSVLLKAFTDGGVPDFGRDWFSVAKAVTSRVGLVISWTPHILALMLVSSFLLYQALAAGERWTPVVLWNFAFLATTVLHLQFAAMGWFYRYEAYLVVLGLMAVAIGWRGVEPAGRWPVVAAQTAMLALLLSPLVARAYVATRDTPGAVGNIYEQQYQMGLFLRRFYPGVSVAANDIGAVSFLSTSHILDLEGLGDNEIARAKWAGQFGPEFIRRRTAEADTRIAIVYERWFRDSLPLMWKRAGEWKIPRIVSAGGDTVVFFAASAADEDALEARLRMFSGQLPHDVTEAGPYLHSKPDGQR